MSAVYRWFDPARFKVVIPFGTCRENVYFTRTTHSFVQRANKQDGEEEEEEGTDFRSQQQQQRPLRA